MGYGLDSIHTATDAQQSVNDAEAIFIGGGNTFRLLKTLYDWDVLQLDSAQSNRRNAIRWTERRIQCRWSNHQDYERHANRLAAIVRWSGLVPFKSVHTFSIRIQPQNTWARRRKSGFFSSSKRTTRPAGLREGAMVRVENGSHTLKGSSGTRIFRKGQEPVETAPGETLDHLFV
jgi:dipeptidase E